VSSATFALAFGVSDYLTNDPKHAKNLVRWQVEAFQSIGDEGSDSQVQKLRYHVCTQEDRDKFFDPSPS
jgi:hypothetical protein